MTIQLRDYQEEAVQAHYRFFDEHAEGCPLFVCPTASGKSVIQAEFLRRTLTAYPDERILCLTHVKELIQQNYEKLRLLWPEAPAGVYSAGLKSRELGQPITFAGIQSFHRIADDFEPPSLVLIDEAHLLPKRGSGMYLSTLETLTRKNPELRVIGYTATPYRLDGGLLHMGDGRIFTHIAYEIPVKRLLSEGYLSRLIPKAGKQQINTAGIGTRNGDFIPSELAARVEGDLDAVEKSVEEAVELSRKHGRKHWIIFACSIAHAEMIYGKLNGLGIPARFVHGGTHHNDRAEFIRMAKAGEITALINVGVLTTGFDWPECDALWFMRPTQSTSLYVQILGRGMRIAPGKESCLVLDYGENVERHGPIDAVRPKRSGETQRTKTCGECQAIMPVSAEFCPDCGADLRTKRCQKCRTESHISALNCAECGHDFSPLNSKLQTIAKVRPEASELELISSDTPPEPEWLEVEDSSLSVWKKNGSPDSVRVTYVCGLRNLSEWKCPAHGGYATTVFRKWWLQMGGSMPFPETAEEAVERYQETRIPARILVAREGKYDRVTKYDMTPRDRAVIADEDIPF